MSTTSDQLSAILIKEYKLTPGQLNLDAQLHDLGIDSLGIVELLWHIEDAFKIKLPSDPVGLTNLGDVVRYVDQLVSEQNVQNVQMMPELGTT